MTRPMSEQQQRGRRGSAMPATTSVAAAPWRVPADEEHRADARRRRPPPPRPSWRSLSSRVMPAHLASDDRGARPRARTARRPARWRRAGCWRVSPTGGVARTASMKSSASVVPLPVIQSVMPFQNVPAPTAAGIRSEPSNRNVPRSGPAGSRPRACRSGSTGWPGPGSCWRETQSARAWPGLSRWPTPARPGRPGTAWTSGRSANAADELAAAEDRLALGRRRSAGSRTRRRRRPRPTFGALGPLVGVERRLAVHRALARRGSAGRPPGTRWWRWS